MLFVKKWRNWGQSKWYGQDGIGFYLFPSLETKWIVTYFFHWWQWHGLWECNSNCASEKLLFIMRHTLFLLANSSSLLMQKYLSIELHCYHNVLCCYLMVMRWLNRTAEDKYVCLNVTVKMLIVDIIYMAIKDCTLFSHGSDLSLFIMTSSNKYFPSFLYYFVLF